jgi:2-iminobutanoate/2-iminopropanoate deaminase
MSEKRTVISTARAPAAIGPYSQAIVANGMVFCSGQIGMNAEGQLVSGGVEAETRQSLENLKELLSAAGSSFGSVVQATLFLKNMADFGAVNAIYGEYFPECPPARACVAAAELPKGALFEVAVTALID